MQYSAPEDISTNKATLGRLHVNTKPAPLEMACDQDLEELEAADRREKISYQTGIGSVIVGGVVGALMCLAFPIWVAFAYGHKTIEQALNVWNFVQRILG